MGKYAKHQRAIYTDFNINKNKHLDPPVAHQVPSELQVRVLVRWGGVGELCWLHFLSSV